MQTARNVEAFAKTAAGSLTVVVMQLKSGSRPSSLCSTPGSDPCGEVSDPVCMHLLAPALMHEAQLR